MILYVNGDSHTAAGEAVNSHCFAKDDSELWYILGEESYYGHPDNLAVSYGKKIADNIGYTMVNHASSAASNIKILRTTYNYLQDNHPNLVIIGWSTWEREEWFNDEDGEYYQVNSSGSDSVPKKWELRYKEFVINHRETIIKKVTMIHGEIHKLHLHLNKLKVPHLFFNSQLNFYGYPDEIISKVDWGDSYIEPYSDFSYYQYLKSQGYKHTGAFHFGADGHQKWADFLMPYLTKIL